MVRPLAPRGFGPRARGLPGLALAAAACLAASPLEGAVQQRGWLGVRVDKHYECLWETNTDWRACDLVMHVTGVQEDGPAAAAGVRPGDRLVAINGREITYGSVDALMASIRAAAPVSVDVMRDGTRYFMHVTPRTPPGDLDRVTWIGPPSEGRGLGLRSTRGRPAAYVVALTDLDHRAGAAFALSIRDTEEGEDVAVEPAALRVVDGQLRLFELDAEGLDMPELRRELVLDIRSLTDSTYREANDAFRILGSIGERLPSEEFRRRLIRIAQGSLDEIRLGVRLPRSFAGAEFEPARRPLADAIDAGREGLLVLRVAVGTPAARLGLRPGDLVFEADGQPVIEIRDLQRALERASRQIEVKWLRKGIEHSGSFPQ